VPLHLVSKTIAGFGTGSTNIVNTDSHGKN